MRIETCTRWLLVAAAAVTIAVRADEKSVAATTAEATVGVVSPHAEMTTPNIAVSAMTVPSPIVLLATPAPVTTTVAPVLAPSLTTATPTTVTVTPSTTTATPTTPLEPSPATTTAKPATTSPTTAKPSTTLAPTTSGSTAGAGTNTVGAPITCAFRYSMPAASNLADELSRLSESNKTKKDSPSTPTPSSNSSSSAADGTSAQGGGGGAAGTNAGTETQNSTQPTAGSGAGDVSLPSAGSPDATMTPVTATPSTTTKTPSMTTKAPITPTSAPVPTTKTPSTTTKAPSATTKPPSSGSLDGAVAGRRLQFAETGVTPSPAPTPTTKKPATTPTTRPPSSPTTTAPPTTDGSGATTTVPPVPTTTKSSDSSGSGGVSPTTAPPTFAPSSQSSSSSAGTISVPTTATVATGEFTCDATFYGAWAHLNLTCGDKPLDVQAAAAQSQCLIYSGVQSSIVDLRLCMSLCKIPKCANGTWDYAAEDGLSSTVYDKLNFVELAKYLGKQQLIGGSSSPASAVLSSLSIKSDRSCAYENEASFSSCQCENLLVDGSSATSPSKATPKPAALMPVVDKGLGDADHWGDGVAKTAIDKVSIASAAIGSSAAAVSVAAGAVMSVAGSVMSTGAGVAGGVSATASLGLAMVAVDICQFSVMVNQMNLDATPRLLQEMGKRMAPSTFSFLPFGKVDTANATEGNGTVVSRRLMDVTNTNQTLGMERYAALIGVKVDMLFYLTLAGVMMLCVAPFVLCALFVGVAAPFVSDFRVFAGKWFDKTVGVLMMILILSEYVVGVTATFQICYLIKYNKPTDAGMFLAIFSLIFFAVGTILYGFWVVKHHEDELRDLGTKDHFEKPVHARYGPLYDEYKFEGRYFFAPKLVLALLCGVTTGFIGMPGIWQVCVLISLHIAFLLYMEVKRPFPTAFVQKTSSFVIIIKISALFLTLFLISSATSLQKDIPVDLREGVGFAIIGLQVLVLLCLMVRQVYIFYVTWKLKREDDEKRENEANQQQQQQQGRAPSFQPLGGGHGGADHNQNRQQQYNQHQQPNQMNQYNHVPIMDGGYASTPLQQQYGGQQTPKIPGRDNGRESHGGPKLRGLQPAPLPAQVQNQGNGMRRTHTVVVHDNATPNNPYRRHGGNEISL